MNVVVTGGGTLAPIDDVRAIANASSGRFAAAIAEACLRRGATVWHLHAPGALLPFLREAQLDLDTGNLEAEYGRLHALVKLHRAHRSRLRLVPLVRGTVGEYAAALAGLLRAHPIDIAYLAMAASDYEPEPTPGKIDSDAEELVLRCRRAPKVIQGVRDLAPSLYLVGFKLLSGSDEATLIREAESACATNRADLTVANDLQTLRAGRHRIHLVRPGHPVEPYAPPDDPAEKLVERSWAWARESFAAREPIPMDEP